MKSVKRLFPYATLLIFVGLLSACGGGGSSSSDTGSSSGGSSSSSGSSSGGSSSSGSSGGGDAVSYSTFKYDLQASATDWATFTPQLTAEGQNGYKYLMDNVFPSTEVKSIYMSDASGSYSYHVLPVMGTSADFIAQANTEGATGYQYYGDLYSGGIAHSLYAKGSTDNATYIYEAQPSIDDADSFLTQISTEGSNGFLFKNESYFFGSGESVAIYQKSSDYASAQYVYQYLDSNPGNSEAFVLDSNQVGAAGYIYKGMRVFSAGTDVRTLYVKDQSQSAVFDVVVQPVAPSAADFLSVSNPLGGQGYAYAGSESFGGESPVDVYLRAGHCKGPLCVAINGLSF